MLGTKLCIDGAVADPASIWQWTRFLLLCLRVASRGLRTLHGAVLTRTLQWDPDKGQKCPYMERPLFPTLQHGDYCLRTWGHGGNLAAAVEEKLTTFALRASCHVIGPLLSQKPP